MTLGARDTTSLVMLTGWDATELKKFELQDGTTYAQVVAETNAALGALNAELYSDPMWSGILSYQDMPEVEYRVGASNGFERHTEYGRPDAKRAEVEGHMLPLLAYDRGLGWTWDYLRKARATQLTADVNSAIVDARDNWRKAILGRLLKRGDESGASYGLGSSGYSPGFATTAGSTSVDFVPPTFGGNTFTNTHEHYVSIAGGVFTKAVFTDAREELREHGHEPGPTGFDFWIGKSDEATVTALTDFVPNAKSNIQYSSTVSLATLGTEMDMNASYYIGTIEDFKVRVVPGIPQYYGAGFKSYGPNSARNPLRARLQKGQTRPLVTAMPDPRAGGGAYPLQYLMLFVEFGIGVGDRTAATPRYVNHADWSDGTAT